jgi:3-phenylpropionate/cinnamic acid dioxygenase small subunit
MTISDTAAVYDNGSIRLHVDWETYFQRLDSFQSYYKEFKFQDNVIQNGTSCVEYFQFCISPIVLNSTFIIYVSLYYTVSLKGKPL